MISQSETGSCNQIICITLFSGRVRLCHTFYQPQQTVQKCWVSLTGTFDFSSSNFNLQGQILSTGRIALTATIEIVVYKRSIVTARSNLGGQQTFLKKSGSGRVDKECETRSTCCSRTPTLSSTALHCCRLLNA
jgi:hypothetical protein